MTNKEFQRAKSVESDMIQLGCALSCIHTFDEQGMCPVFDIHALPKKTLKKVADILRSDYEEKKTEFGKILNGEDQI